MTFFIAMLGSLCSLVRTPWLKNAALRIKTVWHCRQRPKQHLVLGSRGIWSRMWEVARHGKKKTFVKVNKCFNTAAVNADPFQNMGDNAISQSIDLKRTFDWIQYKFTFLVCTVSGVRVEYFRKPKKKPESRMLYNGQKPKRMWVSLLHQLWCIRRLGTAVKIIVDSNRNVPRGD